MPIVEYDRELEYPYDRLFGGRFPTLQLRVGFDTALSSAVDTNAHIDSGTLVSLFDGALLASSTGIDLFGGRAMTYQSALGWSLEARLHKLHFEHEVLGRFELEVGLSTVPIHRNLLGRNFFDLFQIGFREHHQALLLKASP